MWRKSFYFHEIFYAFLSPLPVPSPRPCWLTHRLPGLLAYWGYYYYYLLLECQLGRPKAETKVQHAQILIMENKVAEVGIKVTPLYAFSWKKLTPTCPHGISRKFPLQQSLSSLRGKGLLSLDFFFSPKQETRFQKDIALFSSGNTVLFLDENWLHEPDRKSETTARFV